MLAQVPDKPHKVYANVVSMRITADELVLDFSHFVPEQGSTPAPPPAGIEPDVRIILPANATKAVGQALLKAAQQHEEASNKRTDSLDKAR